MYLLVFSCNPFKRDNKERPNTPEVDWHSLEVVGNAYCAWSRDAYEKEYYVHSKCDGSGFTSLYSVRCDNVDLSVFSDGDGKLWRSPTKDCLSSGQSKSESSRDMVLMRALAAYVDWDRDWFDSFLNYAVSNAFEFCESDGSADGLSRCILTPNLYRLLKDLREGMDRQNLTEITRVTEKSGFRAHLDVLAIWLTGKSYGAIDDIDRDLLKTYADREPKNALYQAVYHRFTDGDMSSVFNILSEWPVDRLPNTSDWCTEYLFQRDMKKDGQENPDWLPCPDREGEHSGTDFNLALYIAMDG